MNLKIPFAQKHNNQNAAHNLMTRREAVASYLVILYRLNQKPLLQGKRRASSKSSFINFLKSDRIIRSEEKSLSQFDQRPLDRL